MRHKLKERAGLDSLCDRIKSSMADEESSAAVAQLLRLLYPRKQPRFARPKTTPHHFQRSTFQSPHAPQYSHIFWEQRNRVRDAHQQRLRRLNHCANAHNNAADVKTFCSWRAKNLGQFVSNMPHLRGIRLNGGKPVNTCEDYNTAHNVTDLAGATNGIEWKSVHHAKEAGTFDAFADANAAKTLQAHWPPDMLLQCCGRDATT